MRITFVGTAVIVAIVILLILLLKTEQAKPPKGSLGEGQKNR